MDIDSTSRRKAGSLHLNGHTHSLYHGVNTIGENGHIIVKMPVKCDIIAIILIFPTSAFISVLDSDRELISMQRNGVVLKPFELYELHNKDVIKWYTFTAVYERFLYANGKSQDVEVPLYAVGSLAEDFHDLPTQVSCNNDPQPISENESGLIPASSNECSVEEVQAEVFNENVVEDEPLHHSSSEPILTPPVSKSRKKNHYVLSDDEEEELPSECSNQQSPQLSVADNLPPAVEQDLSTIRRLSEKLQNLKDSVESCPLIENDSILCISATQEDPSPFRLNVFNKGDSITRQTNQACASSTAIVEQPANEPLDSPSTSKIDSNRTPSFDAVESQLALMFASQRSNSDLINILGSPKTNMSRSTPKRSLLAKSKVVNFFAAPSPLNLDQPACASLGNSTILAEQTADCSLLAVNDELNATEMEPFSYECESHLESNSLGEGVTVNPLVHNQNIDEVQEDIEVDQNHDNRKNSENLSRIHLIDSGDGNSDNSPSTRKNKNTLESNENEISEKEFIDVMSTNLPKVNEVKRSTLKSITVTVPPSSLQAMHNEKSKVDLITEDTNVAILKNVTVDGAQHDTNHNLNNESAASTVNFISNNPTAMQLNVNTNNDKMSKKVSVRILRSVVVPKLNNLRISNDDNLSSEGAIDSGRTQSASAPNLLTDTTKPAFPIVLLTRKSQSQNIEINVSNQIRTNSRRSSYAQSLNNSKERSDTYITASCPKSFGKINTRSMSKENLSTILPIAPLSNNPEYADDRVQSTITPCRRTTRATSMSAALACKSEDSKMATRNSSTVNQVAPSLVNTRSTRRKCPDKDVPALTVGETIDGCTSEPISRRPISKRRRATLSSTSFEDTEKDEPVTLSTRGRKRRDNILPQDCPKKVRTNIEAVSFTSPKITVRIPSLSSPETSCCTPNRNRRTTKPRVVFTLLDSPVLESRIRQLGGQIVDSVDQCTVLVTNEVKRTRKLLEAVCQGKPVCSPSWVEDSRKSGHFLDPWNYVLEDKSAEKKWNFSLKESLHRSRKEKLFTGYTFQILVQDNSADVMRGAIESAGGKCVSKASKSADLNFVIVAKPSSGTRKTKPKNTNAITIDPEAIFDSALRQQIRFDDFRVT